MILLAATLPPDLTGRIEGGWEFVIASYAITWITFALYTLSLWARARREET